MDSAEIIGAAGVIGTISVTNGEAGLTVTVSETIAEADSIVIFSETIGEAGLIVTSSMSLPRKDHKGEREKAEWETNELIHMITSTI